MSKHDHFFFKEVIDICFVITQSRSFVVVVFFSHNKRIRSSIFKLKFELYVSIFLRVPFSPVKEQNPNFVKGNTKIITN